MNGTQNLLACLLRAEKRVHKTRDAYTRAVAGRNKLRQQARHMLERQLSEPLDYLDRPLPAKRLTVVSE